MRSTKAVEVPSHVSPIVGWRIWNCSQGKLYSPLISVYEWPWLEAAQSRCHDAYIWFREEHGAPESNCRCGLYALKEPVSLLGVDLDGSTPFESKLTKDTHGYVIGRVALWGSVVEHEDGFRAQYGYPLELYLPANKLETLGVELAQNYQVPVRDLKELDVPLEAVDANTSALHRSERWWLAWPLLFMPVLAILQAPNPWRLVIFSVLSTLVFELAWYISIKRIWSARRVGVRTHFIAAQMFHLGMLWWSWAYLLIIMVFSIMP